MDVFEAVKTRLEIRDFQQKPVPKDVLKQILEAARFSPTGLNTQHWRFIVVDDPDDIKALAQISTSGKWVEKAAFAVIVLTSPKYPWHVLDAGRAVANMQTVAWSHGVGSCIYTGFDDKAMREKFGIPSDYHIACVAGFGYPAYKVKGIKKRQKLENLVSHGRMNRPISF